MRRNRNGKKVPPVFQRNDGEDLMAVVFPDQLACAENIAGAETTTLDYEMMPRATYCHPQVASFGLTEAQAREAHRVVDIYKTDFRPMKNVVSGRMERGLYKMVTAGPEERVVGLHLIGPDSSEVLQAAAIAVKAGLTKHDFDDTIALHPSMAEELVLMK